MSYWFRRRERYHRPASNVCPSRWMVSPPKHVLRGWPTCYDGGTDTSAGRTPLGWRYTCLLGGRTTTAVLIHLLGGHLLVDDTLTLASWSDIHVTTAIHQLGGQHHLVDDTLTLASWSDIHVTTAIHQLGGQHHLVHYAYYLYLWGEHHFGGATRTLPTWADVSFGHTLLAGRWYQAGDTRIPLPRKSLWTPQKIVDCKVGLCTSLRTVAKFL